MWAYWVLFLLLFSSTSAFATPALVVEHLEYDFGEVIQGAEVSHTFRFHNAGDQILNISQLRSSCGCTAAMLTTRKLAPGAIGELQLTFASQGFRGEVEKMVTFETDDPRHAAVTFHLRGKVKAELLLQPERINWGVVTKGAGLHAEIDIVNRSTQTITLQPPEITAAGITAEMSHLTIVSGEQARLAITARFPEGKKRLAGYVIINTNFPSLPQIRVPVSARLAHQ
ncbi:DUF1573 domain-containing protein [uncultured Desulfuromusa sp.]|uniref:DUF1573 domain-containing protein n=1 Tax=uncultured Desulfuromusa sp. TaxID=219183 RepID=UPI002AA819EC|nr:DUF1573 domain-containing protein [uncultured Desulfuromusa sp.]